MRPRPFPPHRADCHGDDSMLLVSGAANHAARLRAKETASGAWES